MFYLTMLLIHFYYGYMALEINDHLQTLQVTNMYHSAQLPNNITSKH